MIEIIVNPELEQWNDLCRRLIDTDRAVTDTVRAILDQVRLGGDDAVREITETVDGFRPGPLLVSAESIDGSAGQVSRQLKDAIDTAYANIRKFHQAQLREDIELETSPGVRCSQRSIPIKRVGLYIPGGRAPLFSTVLMLAIPATVAGCREVILCTPANSVGEIDPAILYCAKKCGVREVYGIGGAQAIAAMAYGTGTIKRVDKIFGPGNKYVTTAKQMVSADTVAVDMPAGPSEVMVLADDTAHPEFVASDLLSQAEHGPDSQSILVTNSQSLARRVADEIKVQLEKLSRKDVAGESLKNSRIVVMGNTTDMISFANRYAAEHLIISMKGAWDVADAIECAGSVFIGNYSPESAGDYASGTNHTLPTAGWARSYSGVTTDSFMKKISYQEITAQGLLSLGDTIITMAEAEGLDAHANAVRVRLNKLDYND